MGQSNNPNGLISSSMVSLVILLTDQSPNELSDFEFLDSWDFGLR